MVHRPLYREAFSCRKHENPGAGSGIWGRMLHICASRSVLLLKELRFLQGMHETMDKYDIDPSYIEVEVTESVMTEKLEDLKHCMIELAQMGFRIAIDDFGTGYSSLSVLYEIPANVVKIDKSFTDKVMVDNKGEFVSQMGKFIRAAKEEIVVEGIETEEQRQFLESHGFEYGQGYLFDRPIPADEFERKYL